MTQAFTWMSHMLCPIIDNCTRELKVGNNFPYRILFSQLIIVCNECLVLLQTCSRTVVDLK